MENFIKRAFSTFLLAPMTIFALMEGHQEVPGVDVHLRENHPNIQEIRTSSHKTVINCAKFNIAKGEEVHFLQPSSKSSVLCRVTGKAASIIDGRLETNGRLILINPMSIVFREHAFVKAHHLLASTLDMRDEDFLNDKYKFSLSKDAENSCVVNLGTIEANQTVLMAPQLVNRGTIRGKVAFLGGKEITINFEGDEKFSFVIDEPLQSGFAEIAGKIEAQGKDVLIRHRVAQHLITSVVNANGLIEATKMEKVNGVVRLVAQGMIDTDTLAVEGRTIEKAIDLKIKQKADFVADKELRWEGGAYGSLYKDNKGVVKAAVTNTQLSLQVRDGKLVIDGCLGEENVSPYDKLIFSAKTIDQNAYVRGRRGVVYNADLINLSETAHSNADITFNGPVVVKKNNIAIRGGDGLGTVKFNSTLDSAHPGISLRISGATESGVIQSNHPIGSKGQFDTLTLSAGKLNLHNIGGQSPGAKHLDIQAHNSKKDMESELLGSIYRAGDHNWKCAVVFLRSSKPVSFISDNGPMTFEHNTKLHLNPESKVHFDVHGGEFELPQLGGNNSSAIVNARKANMIIHEISECSLKAICHKAEFKGEIKATTLSIDTEENILNSKLVDPSSIHTKGELILNSKNGGIGEATSRLRIHAEGKLWVGAKECAFFEGHCLHELAYDIEGNKSFRTHLLITEPDGSKRDLVYSRETLQKIIANEVKKNSKPESISSDLEHLIPHGFVDEAAFVPQRAPLFYLQGIPKLIGSKEEDSESEKVE